MKLVSVNIELAWHLDAVAKFLKRENPDVVCLQEVFEQDLRQLANALGMEYEFGQMANTGRKKFETPPLMPFGVGILSRSPLGDVQCLYYKGDVAEAKQTHFIRENVQEIPRLVLLGAYVKEGVEFSIGTTHFTWSANGKVDNVQRQDMQKLLDVLENVPEIVLCGDFNAPRGGKLFAVLAKRYIDNIPQGYTTSVDVNLHHVGQRLRGKSLMIDGLFTSKHYQCSNVRLQDGVSDHMAIVADVQKMYT